MRQTCEKVTRAARREHWRELIEAAEASGGTIRGFCQKHGIQPSHYYYWRQRLKAEREARPPAAGREFVLLGAAGITDEGAAMLELVVERGWRLRIGAGVEERALRVVLAALAAQS